MSAVFFSQSHKSNIVSAESVVKNIATDMLENEGLVCKMAIAFIHTPKAVVKIEDFLLRQSDDLSILENRTLYLL